jgi:excinuclease UvrABC nuclease subunit
MNDKSPISRGRMKHANSHIDMPNAPGIYRHVDRITGEVNYIGQTGNLRQRTYQHTHDGKFNPATQRVEYSVAYPDATRDDLCQGEVRHIAKHQPSGNSTRGGNGRR